MKTIILGFDEIETAAGLLKKGEVVAFPTETVYGLGVIYDNEEAYKKLIDAKKRAPNKPFTLMCSSLEESINFIDIDNRTKRLMERFFPGQLTVIVKAKKGLPSWVTLGSEFIGIRIPDSEFVRSLIAKVGKPCLVTSANKSGEPTSTLFEDVEATFAGEISAIVKGKCVSNEASTIIKIDDNGPSLIRSGPIDFNKIIEAWEEEI